MERIEHADGSVTYHIRVEAPEVDRLDRYLSETITDLSRSQAASLIQAGRVTVNEEKPRKSRRLEPGDQVIVDVPPPASVTAQPEDIPVDVIYEDDALLVVDKPAGMVVHPAPGHATGTLVNALLFRVERLSSIGGDRRPGIVHRLDKDTSGLLVVAKQELAHQRLAAAISRRAIERCYLAACWGHLPEDALHVDADVARHPRDRQRMAVVPGGRPASTRFHRVERWRSADYLRVELHTGRTHQIRVHLHHIGHPLVGDRQYGAGWERGLAGRWPRDLSARVPRQFLHAAELRFEHPLTGHVLEFSTPLPPDLAAVAEWARRTS